MAESEGVDRCIVCGVTGYLRAMNYCDGVTDGPWCDEHFGAATGCTDEAHGEDCRTQVFQLQST